MARLSLSQLFLFSFTFLLLIGQVFNNPLLAPTPEPTPFAESKALTKRVTIDLPAVWKKAKKVPLGNALGWKLDRTKYQAYSTALFYGCTIVVVADGKHVIIGHHAQEKAEPGSNGQVPCYTMYNEQLVEKKILPRLVDAENDVGGEPGPGDGTQAWIITTAPKGSPGYKVIKEWLDSHRVADTNVHYVRYTGGSMSEDGPAGKVVVQWTTGQNGGGTLAVFIQRNNDIFHQNFNAQGNPVGRPNQRKRDGAYKTLPGSASMVDDSRPPASTNTDICQVCPTANANKNSCSSLTGCLPKKAQATVQAGSSPVHVGTLTGAALSTSVSKALAKLCPTPSKAGAATACSTHTFSIGGIDYLDDGFLEHDGKFDVKVEASSYNETNLRNAMIDSAALTAMQATQSKSNCYKTKYNEIDEVGKMRTRRSAMSDYLPGFAKRALGIRDHPHTIPTDGPMFCNTVGFAGVQYYNRYWRLQENPGATNWIDASWSFHRGPGGDFLCDFLEGLADALIAVAPEFTVGDIELGEEIYAGCDAVMDKGG